MNLVLYVYYFFLNLFRPIRYMRADWYACKACGHLHGYDEPLRWKNEAQAAWMGMLTPSKAKCRRRAPPRFMAVRG